MKTQTQNYEAFLAQKDKAVKPVGFECEVDFDCYADYQTAIVEWSLRRGRSALFCDTGLRKTAMQLGWSHLVSRRIGKPALILAPLAVAEQTSRECKKYFRFEVEVCETQSDVQPGLNITNYEKLHHFTPDTFGAIVVDESSCIKAFDGKFRKQLMEFVEGIHYRLACTATPAPNDLIEIINHAEFLGIMSGKEIIALYFTQDGNTTHKWRLKGHAREGFWKWVSSWAVAMRKPSDLGFSDEGFTLPPLNILQVTVDGPPPKDALFDVGSKTMQERRRVRKDSLTDRVSECAARVNASKEPWIVWCDFNDESEALRKAIDGAVEVKGSDSAKHKADAMIGFSEGRYRVLISKPSICGFGMNWQHCRNVAFVGMSDSYEQQYQAIRRCWRYGQQEQVNVWQIVSEADGDVVANIQRKEREHTAMMDSLVSEMNIDGGMMSGREEMAYGESETSGDGWRLLLGDSIKRVAEIETDSIGLSVYSPPFPGMYVYSNSPHDVGNCDNVDEMIEHFRFLAKEMLRITMPGRMNCVHLCQLTAMKSRDGYIGLKDYRGKVIQLFTEEGWIWAGEVTIDKNPQIQATRNKERGLMFKSLANDSSVMRMALADYVIYFRKPGENPKPIRAGVSEKYKNPNGWITEDEWIEWAAPVWYRHASREGRFAMAQPDYPALLQSCNGVSETDVLNVTQARDTNDERHLCPLQLGVIERCVKLWSAPGDVVFSPFAGIGSEGYESVRLNRQFIGVELKPSYYSSAIRNLREAERLAKEQQHNLFDFVTAQAEAGQEPEGEAIDVPVTRKEGVPLIAEPEPVKVEKPKRTRKAKAAIVASAPVAEADDFFNFA